MTSRTQLKWPVPRSPWEHHERRTIDRYGTKRLYAGIEAERIAQLWLTFEETDATPRAGHTGAALKETKKESTTPLADQEKIEVHRDFHRETKERLDVHAERYDVNKGVLLGYILREYYETDGWGYGIEAAEANDRGVPDEDDKPEIPHRESEKIEWIAERIEPNTDGSIHGEQIRELVGEIRAASRAAYYQEAVIDHLNYVHHPEAHDVFISQEQRWEEFGLQEDNLAIERKPYKALTREEKLDGIKAVLQRTGKGFSATGIHSAIFNGKGSAPHMRNLVQDVANANGFTSGETPGGTTVIRATGSGSESDTDTITDASGDTQTTLTDTDTDTDSEDETETEAETTDDDTIVLDDQSDKSLSAINQFPIDELGPSDQAAKIQIATTRQTLREDCTSGQFTVDAIQEALALDGDGEIDEAAMEARMEAAANTSGFSIRTTDDDHGQELAVDRGKINRGIEIMAEQCLEEGEESDTENSGKPDDHTDETDEIETEAERAMAAQQQGQAVKPGDDIDTGIESSAVTDGGTDLGHGRDGDGDGDDRDGASHGGGGDPI